MELAFAHDSSINPQDLMLRPRWDAMIPIVFCLWLLWLWGSPVAPNQLISSVRNLPTCQAILSARQSMGFLRVRRTFAVCRHGWVTYFGDPVSMLRMCLYLSAWRELEWIPRSIQKLRRKRQDSQIVQASKVSACLTDDACIHPTHLHFFHHDLGPYQDGEGWAGHCCDLSCSTM